MRTQDHKAIWDFIQMKVAQYDWAVEGFPAPANAEIKDRDEATKRRQNLLQDLRNLTTAWERE